MIMISYHYHDDHHGIFDREGHHNSQDKAPLIGNDHDYVSLHCGDNYRDANNHDDYDANDKDDYDITTVKPRRPGTPGRPQQTMQQLFPQFCFGED